MKKVAVVNMKGGVAKTTLAVNLAHALHRQKEKKVLLVDLDPQFNATQCLLSGDEYVELRKKGGHTILNIFDDSPGPSLSAVKGVSHQKAIKLGDIKPWEIDDGLHLIPGDLELYRLEMGSAQGRELRLRRYLQGDSIAGKYDFVIIDTPPTPSHWMMSGLLAADAYLVPVKPEPLSRVGVDLLQGVINRCVENHGHDIECVGVVLTIADRRTLVFQEAIDFFDNNESWKGKRFEADLPSRTAIARAQGRQQLILDTNTQDAKVALAGIAAEFLERIE